MTRLAANLLHVGAPWVFIAAVLTLKATGYVPNEELDAVELFAGRSIVTRCLRAMKYRVAALDLAYDASYRKRSTKRGKKPAKGQLFDLLSPSGFAMAIMSCLACVQDNHVIVIAVVCSSFVSISRGSVGRSYLNPLGFPDCAATKIGNLLASRLALLLYLIASRGGVWVVEQPSSSLLFRHPRLREVCRRMKVIGSTQLYRSPVLMVTRSLPIYLSTYPSIHLSSYLAS
ncbi:Uncharacterized protein SCF082_LOCUS31802 [Durusdinium trenchii]|uniref:Uncharacterized protein n=1 Tax=Durusdinium trenchii TaxID=1381693 RepID=A0ABP0N981_9DINO